MDEMNWQFPSKRDNVLRDRSRVSPDALVR